MWTISIEKCVRSLFSTEEVRYVCKCGSVLSYTGCIQPVRCKGCQTRLPDLQLIRKSSMMRALCHSDYSGFVRRRADHIESCFD